MKKIISLIGILVGLSTAQAQYVTDALRFSQNFPAITARSVSMGGAFSSLGGDFSSSYFNPAGLGLYRKSEFLLTPQLNYSRTKTEYLGQEYKDYKYQFALGSMGYVGTYNSSKDKGLVSASYAIGYNRLNNFNNMSNIKGESSNSLVDYFWENANGVDPENLDPFYERLAFDAYVLDTIAGSNFDYFGVVEHIGDVVTQRRVIETKGGIGDWTFAFGLNFSNRIYFGMGLGIYDLNFSQKTTHAEFDERNLNYFSNFYFTENVDVEGVGISMNFGIMARIIEALRVGASLHLPTYYRLEEAYKNTMYSEFDNGFIPSEVNGDIYAEGTFDYKLHTPLKLLGGISYQIGKVAIVSADLEFIDYSSMQLKPKEPDPIFEDNNQIINDIYCSVLNLKIGSELRFDNAFIRLGGGYYPSPYVSDELNEDASYTEITSGIGYRNKNFFFDFGFSALMHKERYVLYFDNVSDLNQQKYRFLATVGFRF